MRGLIRRTFWRCIMATHMRKYLDKTLKRHPAVSKALVRFGLYRPTNPYKYLTLKVQRMDRGMLDGMTTTEAEQVIYKEGYDTQTHVSVFFLGNDNKFVYKQVSAVERPVIFAEHISLTGMLKVKTMEAWSSDFAYHVSEGEVKETDRLVSGILIVVQNKFYKQDVIDAWKMTDFAMAGGVLDAILFLPPKDGYVMPKDEKYYKSALVDCRDSVGHGCCITQECFEKNVEGWRLHDILTENGMAFAE